MKIFTLQLYISVYFSINFYRGTRFGYDLPARKQQEIMSRENDTKDQRTCKKIQTFLVMDRKQ